jgi:hypothetical protein
MNFKQYNVLAIYNLFYCFFYTNLMILKIFDLKFKNLSYIKFRYGGLHSRTIIFTETKKEANEIMLKAKLKTEC